MRLVTLVENTAQGGIGCAHGLSIYAETAKHKVLFDMGPSGELLFSNAAKLGIDLCSVDTAILSHGHYDHAGGLRTFLEKNSTAIVYIHNIAATRPHLALNGSQCRDIGMDSTIIKDFADRIILTDKFMEIDDELLLFSDIRQYDYISDSNNTLYEKINGEIIPDSFHHEQNLLIYDCGKICLLAGCAHRGIVNILRRAEEISGNIPDAVIAGFHLTNPGLKLDMPESFVRKLAAELKKYPSTFYTGHCTGTNPYAVLKEEIPDRMNCLYSGLDVTM